MRTPFAYLDAGSASAIVSMILGGVAALGVAVRYRWNQLLRLLKIRKDDEEETTPAPTSVEASTPATADAPQREPVETK